MNYHSIWVTRASPASLGYKSRVITTALPSQTYTEWYENTYVPQLFTFFECFFHLREPLPLFCLWWLFFSPFPFFLSFFFAAELILISSSSLDANGAALAEARLRGRAWGEEGTGSRRRSRAAKRAVELPRAPIELLALEKKLRLSANTALYVADVQHVFFQENFGSKTMPPLRRGWTAHILANQDSVFH